VKRHAGENDLVIFPQYGLPIDAKRKGDLFKRLVRETNTAVLLGTYIPVTEGASLTESKRTNSALLFTPDGRLQEYKAVLAPPFRQIGQVMGTKFQLLKLGNVRLGVLLCYEDVNPRHTRALVRQGADLLVALSNPGHFTKTHLPRFHLLHDQARAIENGKTLLRVSPNGISAVIDLNGRVTHETKLDQEAVLTAEITTVFSG
jgi:apolipoprotein N-acyltransferase